MWDAFIIISFFSLFWYKSLKEIPISGIPLLFLFLAFSFYGNFFPKNVYFYNTPSIFEFSSMVVATDFLQFLIHTGTHKKVFGKLIYDSHNIHHREKNPQPKDAFSTGFLDAFIQLIIPLYISILLVKPNRCSVILFGLLYSQSLFLIHSDKKAFLSKYLVSAEYHKKHHKNPDTNFSHILPVWDFLYSQSLRVVKRF